MNNHPCFNANCRTLFGRVHLPIAAKCNIQCNYCNRKTDCINESRPGVSSRILTPLSAVSFLLKRKDYINKSISVIGIAGPGDPMATPEITLETLSRVRDVFPNKILCLSTNGLNLSSYINELVKLKVSHVTITINAVNSVIGSKIYQWVSYSNSKLYGIEAAELLLKKQFEAIEILKQQTIYVKINTVVIPGINDNHITDIAKKIAQYNVDIHNCIAVIPVLGTPFEAIQEPSAEEMVRIRKNASCYLNQSYYCNRCRADAIGYLK